MITIDSSASARAGGSLLDGVTMHLPRMPSTASRAREERPAPQRLRTRNPRSGFGLRVRAPAAAKRNGLPGGRSALLARTHGPDCIGLVRYNDRSANPEALLRRFPVPLGTEAPDPAAPRAKTPRDHPDLDARQAHPAARRTLPRVGTRTDLRHAATPSAPRDRRADRAALFGKNHPARRGFATISTCWEAGVSSPVTNTTNWDAVGFRIPVPEIPKKLSTFAVNQPLKTE